MKKGALELDAMLPGTRVRSEFGTVWVKDGVVGFWFREMFWGAIDYERPFLSGDLPSVEVVTS